MNYSKIQSGLEAILFASGDSVEEERLCSILDTDIVSLESAAELLEKKYIEESAGIRLIRLDGRLQLVSSSDWSDEIIRTLEKRKQNRLSQSALEVLAIVAYYQPITRASIENIRGVDSSYTVSYLLEKGLIEQCGRVEAPGRPVLYGTTENFLRVMSISTLEELPPMPDVKTNSGIEELKLAIERANPQENVQIEISEIEK